MKSKRSEIRIRTVNTNETSGDGYIPTNFDNLCKSSEFNVVPLDFKLLITVFHDLK